MRSGDDRSTTTAVEELEFVNRESLSSLNRKQSILFAEGMQSVIGDLRTIGKNPERKTGYAESNLRPIVRRIIQIYQYIWDQEGVTLKLTPGQADIFIRHLSIDKMKKRDGTVYTEGSKRKFVDALNAYFRVRETDWESPINFSDGNPEYDSDPLTRIERQDLLQASMEYQTPPSYSNVSPKQRDEWKAYLAQQIGKPKSKISPEDWKKIRQSWKIPSLISFGLDAGARAALINRLTTDLVHPSCNKVEIPKTVAVKNNSSWTVECTETTSRLLDKWLKQRAHKRKYDDAEHVWLNRKGNPYRSATLNNLLSNLFDVAQINPQGRKLTWHSIRHSTGMYTYDESTDIALVADVLRLESLEAARIYAHPTPETERSVLESISGGI